jgi:hypothetical protein
MFKLGNVMILEVQYDDIKPQWKCTFKYWSHPLTSLLLVHCN